MAGAEGRREQPEMTAATRKPTLGLGSVVILWLGSER
jgi:hypothetical protein